MKKNAYAIGAVVLLLLAAGLWFGGRQAPPPAPPPVAQPAVPLPVTPSPEAAAPVVSHPIAAAAQAASSPPDVDASLIALFGRRLALTMFHLDDFPHRFVATVDNLARGTASAALWPLAPAGGRFTVDDQGGSQVVGAANAERYAPYVRLIEGVDLQAAVTTYVRLYPLFQQAYADLGYPRRFFNDRLIEVIDLLLSTPDAGPSPKVHRPVVQGSMPPVRPWVLYEFDDSALQSLSAGQRMLLRMGDDNAHRVKARLSELRRLLVAAEPAPPAQH